MIMTTIMGEKEKTNSGNKHRGMRNLFAMFIAAVCFLFLLKVELV